MRKRITKKQKSEVNKWINSLGVWRYFMTLPFRFTVKRMTAELAFQKWKNMVEHKLFPRHSGKQLNMFAVMEESSSKQNHFHVLLEDLDVIEIKNNKLLTATDFRKIARAKWRKISSSGFNKNEHFLKLIEEDKENVINYILKTAKEDNDFMANL